MARPATGITKERLNITLSAKTKQDITRIAQDRMQSVSALVEEWTQEEVDEEKRRAENVGELRKAKEANGVVLSILVSVSDPQKLEKLQTIAQEKNTTIESLIQDVIRSKQDNFIDSCLADLLKD